MNSKGMEILRLLVTMEGTHRVDSGEGFIQTFEQSIGIPYENVQRESTNASKRRSSTKSYEVLLPT